MTTPKNVDYMTEEKFKKLKECFASPKYINNKMIPTYAIHRDDKLCGFIGIKEFEYKFEK